MNDRRFGEALDRENDRRLGVYLRDEDEPEPDEDDDDIGDPYED